MIVDFVFNMVVSFLTFAIGLLPNFQGLPSGISSGFQTIQPFINSASAIFPMDTLIQILLLTISIQLAVFAWDMFWWFYAKIPGKFT